MDKAQVFQSSSITGPTQKNKHKKNTRPNLCLVMLKLYLNISLYHKISSAAIIMPNVAAFYTKEAPVIHSNAQHEMSHSP